MAGKKQKLSVTLLSAILAAAVVFAQNAFAFDENENTQQHAELAEENSQLEQKIDETDDELVKKQAETQKLQKQISELSKKIKNSNKKILDLNSQIKDKQSQIDEKLDAITDRLNLLRSRLRSIYMQGDTSSLEIILGAKDFSDFIDKAEMMKNISDYDNKLISSLQSEMEVIEQDRDSLRADKEAAEKEKKELENNRKKINQLNQENTKIIEQLKNTREDLEDSIKENNARQQELERALEAYNQSLAEQEKAKREQQQIQQQQERQQKIQQRMADNPEIVIESAGVFVWPCPGHTNLTSTFDEWRGANNHGALDIADGDVYGAKVIACYDGVVISTCTSCTHDYGKFESCGCGGGYGNYVMIDHGGGKVSIYGHLSGVAVNAGQTVSSGQLIGYVGSTGYSTGPHLHFEMQLDGVRYDPLTEYGQSYGGTGYQEPYQDPDDENENENEE